MAISELVVADGKVHVPPERRDLSMVFQDYALWPHMVARDNVAFALKLARTAKSEASVVRVAMLEGASASGKRWQGVIRPKTCSGGEQQRVALARALIGDTGLILCDEPLSNLDADLRERMRVEISSLVRSAGATTIYITHDQSEAFALADRVGVLERGRLVQIGTPEEIYAHPATPFVARFTGLAGELLVRVRSEADEESCVEVEPATFQGARYVRARIGGQPLGGSEALLVMRPTAVRLCAIDTGEHHLLGQVADVAFRGRGYEHAVELAEGTQINSIFSESRFSRGQSVGLRLETSGCLVFPVDEGPASGSGDIDVPAQGVPGEAQSRAATALALQRFRLEGVRLC